MKRSRPQASAKTFISALAAKKARQTPESAAVNVDNSLAEKKPTQTAPHITQTGIQALKAKEQSTGNTTATASALKQAQTASVDETITREVEEEYQIQYVSASDSDVDAGDYQVLISDSEEEQPQGISRAKSSDVIDLDESVQVSTFAPTRENLLETEDIALFGFSHGQTLVIQGQYSIRIIKGSVSVCGAKLAPSSKYHKIFAPSTHAIPTIVADSQGSKDIPTDTVRNKLMDIIPASFTRAVNGFLQFDVIIAIKSLFTGIENLEKICQNLKNVWISPDVQHGRSYEILYRVPQPPPALITLQETWESPVRNICQRIRESSIARMTKRTRLETGRPIIFICGPKSAGKSTFARLLTNSLLTADSFLAPDNIPKEVAYMELDPGQPEFGPSGVLSLNVIDSPILGPSWAHATLSSSVKASHFGYTTPRDAPQDYVRHVSNLVSHYNNDMHRFTDNDASHIELPLIVNTPGWTKGHGVEVLRQIIDIIGPSIIVYIGPRLTQPDNNDTNFELADALRSRSPQTSLLELAPIGGDSGHISAKYSAADLRVAQTMAYFHATGDQTWDFSLSLTSWRPYVVRYGGDGDGDLHGIEILGNDMILDEHIPAAINGTIVGISIASADAALNVASIGDSSLPMLETPTLGADADAINCLGLGIIRAIDPATATLQVLTPISPRTIFDAVSSSNKIVFSRGRLPLPIWAAWDGDQSGVARRPWRKVPYLSMDEIVSPDVRAAVGGQSLRVRRNVMRRSQQIRT
ncbi:hypothetical protein V1509DRAFT_631911 [Lipomyces kononenkoae]